MHNPKIVEEHDLNGMMRVASYVNGCILYLFEVYIQYSNSNLTERKARYWRI